MLFSDAAQAGEEVGVGNGYLKVVCLGLNLGCGYVGVGKM